VGFRGERICGVLKKSKRGRWVKSNIGKRYGARWQIDEHFEDVYWMGKSRIGEMKERQKENCLSCILKKNCGGHGG